MNAQTAMDQPDQSAQTEPQTHASRDETPDREAKTDLAAETSVQTQPSGAASRAADATKTTDATEATEDASVNANSHSAGAKTAADLERVLDVPVRVSVVLGCARIPVSRLLELAPGSVLQLDRKVGEAIDIFVNDRLAARGEVVMVNDKLGVTMTEIIKDK